MKQADIEELGLIKKNTGWKVKLSSIRSLFKMDYLQMSVKNALIVTLDR